MKTTERVKYEQHRQTVISYNRSRLCRGLPALAVPAKLPPLPRRVQLLDTNGDYIGTWPAGVSAKDAKADAITHGHTPGKTIYC